MGLYDRLSATALRLLAKFGQLVIRQEVSVGAYDPATSSATQTTTETTRIGVLLDYPPGTLYGAGTLVEQGDKQLFLDAAGPVALTDIFLIAGQAYTVASVSELSPAGVVVLYELRVQG